MKTPLYLHLMVLATWATQVPRSGLYSNQLLDYQIVIPKKLEKVPEPEKRRQERGIKATYYSLQINNEEVILELYPSVDFISPSLLVERWKNGTRHRRHVRSVLSSEISYKHKRSVDSEFMPKNLLNCHYKGSIRGQELSLVAISTCYGMSGLILSEKHGEFWVEPIRNQEPNNTEKEHLIFKRATAVPETKKKKRKKKKKHEKNCGTREPRRLAEMRLEWQQQPGKVKVQGRGRSRKNRWRRSISQERQVEALIVADQSMIKFHELLDVEGYILIIMNMVSSLFKDPSIGNQININVVKIILLEDDSAAEGLNVTVHADRTLESFCKWQDQMKLNETTPLHDVAILITRVDICARDNKPCGTLGVAHVGGMCQRERSCNVNEDNGITLAHTITHELGHNFGMYHDTEKIGCSRRDGSTQHIMTPSFEADTVQIAWSPCSRRDITNFLDRGLGECLDDFEVEEPFYKYEELPPGAKLNAERQCKLQFGNKSTEVCSPSNEICSRLWCMVDGNCVTMLKPAAPGTICGKGMWCVDHLCVPMGDTPKPVQGGWSDWGPWSACSRSCGAGVAIQERHCNHPTPANGGRYCIGERRKYKVCNTEDCPEGTASFREVQCTNFNNETFHGKKYTWIPYFDKAEPCELYCSDTEDTLIVPWGDSALDGTPCRVGSRDMCIKGICKRVGCDWVVDSDAVEDKCGICHGSGDQCDTISGVYNKTTGSGYIEIVMIPAGARNIHVRELGNSKNYLGIGSASSNKFYLNGKREITIAREYHIAGASGLYERDDETESIHVPGPIKEDIVIFVIHRPTYQNMGVSYNYTILKVAPTEHKEYQWQFSDWTVCSSTCGGGTQSSRPICKERFIGEVDESQCDQKTKLDVKMRVCNAFPCPTRWWAGPWQLCPVTCGDATDAFRKRTVLCIKQLDFDENQKERIIIKQHSASTLGGIEYIEESKNPKEYKKEIEEEIIALADEDCEGEERPLEQEVCPNLPPCNESTIATPDWNRSETESNDYIDDLETLMIENPDILSHNEMESKKKEEKKKNKYDLMKPITERNKELRRQNGKKHHRKFKRKRKEKYRAKNIRVEELTSYTKYNKLKGSNRHLKFIPFEKFGQNSADR